MAVSTPRGLDTADSDAKRALLALLADGRPRSGDWLARELGVCRAAVLKDIERLRFLGIGVDAVPRRGYRLKVAVELLDALAIRRVLQPGNIGRLRHLELLFEVDSTNTRLLAAAPPPRDAADVVLSELQHAGRGRRGRQWVAPFGTSLALSLSWTFADASKATPALSLGVGVAVVRALARAGASGVRLKWPNDIWLADRKIGGILLELRAEAGGPAHVVIGIGINVVLTTGARRQIEATGVRVAAVGDACAVPPSRNFISGAIIDELLSMLVEFERSGFARVREAWTALDGLRDRQAHVLLGDTCIPGIVRGVTSEGALRLESDGALLEFVSGELSLRLVEGDI